MWEPVSPRENATYTSKLRSVAPGPRISLENPTRIGWFPRSPWITCRAGINYTGRDLITALIVCNRSKSTCWTKGTKGNQEPWPNEFKFSHSINSIIPPHTLALTCRLPLLNPKIYQISRIISYWHLYPIGIFTSSQSFSSTYPTLSSFHPFAYPIESLFLHLLHFS